MAVRNIVQQSSGYCFRMVIPNDLRPVIGKRELRYSLHERPLHDTLIDLGFLNYVQSLPKKGRLFPKFKRINNRYGHAFGQWFSNFKKRIGIAPNQTFHSYRHTVATNLAERDVPDHRISMLLGHALEGQTKGRYIKRFQPKMLKEKVVDHIDYGIDLEYLKSSKFVVK